MMMPNRSYSATTGYRYGFNGKENDNEVKGEGNEIDYGARVFDPRVGKFLSVDPLQKQYPELTPYQFASNNPVAGIDIDGREFEWFMLEKAEKYLFGTTHLKNFSEGFTERAINTVKGMTNGNIPEPLKKLMTNMRLATTDPNVAKENTANMFQSAKIMTDAMTEGVKHTAKELADLTKKAFKGDVKAMGALGFEAVMLLAPGGEEAKGASMGGRFITRAFEEGATNVERITALGLKDGMEVGWKKGLELAEDYLGKGYTEVEKGRFVSKDGTRQVRMAEDELSGKKPLHLNFETLKKNPKKPGKVTTEKNIHVNLKE